MSQIETLFPLAGPNQLYGRETDVGAMLELLDAASAGRCEFLLISGEPGIGKTALALALERPVADMQGLFLHGKFRQLGGHRPLAAFLDALADLARQLADSGAAGRKHWSETLARRLGRNVAALVDLVPEMAEVCGAQGKPPELAPVPARQRTSDVILETLAAVAESRHSLVLLLDDLHWADVATFDVLERVLQSDLPRTLVVATCRKPAHEIELAIEKAARTRRSNGRADNARTCHLRLPGLTTFDIQSVLSERLGGPRKRYRELATQCQAHCLGNPLRLQHFLRALYARRLLQYDRATGSWTWDEPGIQRMQRSADIVDLVRIRLESLPLDVVHLLSVTACFGGRANLADVAALCEITPEDAQRLARSAEREKLLHCTLTPQAAVPEAPIRTVVFAHDQIEQAAYQLRDEPTRLHTHLQISWMLAGQGRRQDILEAAGHLMHALALLDTPQEREAAVVVMLRASNAARRMTGWKTSWKYARAGLELLGEDAWRAHRILAFALSRNLFEATCFAAPATDLDEMLDDLLARDLQPLQRAELHWIRCAQLLAQGQLRDSQQHGYAALRFCLPDLPEMAEISGGSLARLQREIDARLADLPEDWLGALPETRDETVRFTLQLLPEFMASASLSGNQLIRGYLGLIAMRTLLDHGRVPGNQFAVAAYAMYLGSANRIAQAGRTAALCAHQPDLDIDDRAFSASALALAPVALHYALPFQESCAMLERANRAAWRVGSTLMGLGCLYNAAALQLASGMPLKEQLYRVEEYRAQARPVGANFAQTNLELFRDHIRALNASPQMVPAMTAFRSAEAQPGNAITVQADWLAHLRLQLVFWRGERELLPALLDVARAHLHLLRGLPQLIEFHFIDYFCLLHELAPAAPAQRRERMDLATRLVRQAAEGCPANYAHLQSIMDAERAWHGSEDDLALMLFRQAIREAGLYNNLPWMALAQERLAHLLDARGAATEADSARRVATAVYLEWGCHARAEQTRSYQLRPRPD